jgi:hypothetical protein
MQNDHLSYSPPCQENQWALMKTLKHSQKASSVCGGHLISINFPLGNWEVYYVYSSRMGGNLSLLVGVRTLPLFEE